MPAIIVIDANGSLKEVSVRSVDETEIYKKAGLKSADGFSARTTWNVALNEKTYNVTLYGKTTGRAGQENKYDFPPPVDSLLLFGKCVLVNSGADLKLADWTRVYEHLFGGFDDIGSEDSDEDDEDLDDDAELTKTGYVKDDFVVDDDEEVEEEGEGDDEEEEEEVFGDSSEDEPVKSKSKNKSKSNAKPKKATGGKKVSTKRLRSTVNKASSLTQPAYLDCTSELVEEAYV